MRKWGLVLIAMCWSFNLQAQVKIDTLVFGIQHVTTESMHMIEGEKVTSDGLKNSTEADIEVYLSRDRWYWPGRSLRNALRGNDNVPTSMLPSGSKKDILGFEAGDYIVMDIPEKAFYYNGEYGGIKVIFDHTIETRQTSITFQPDNTVRVILQITEMPADLITHIFGHVCSPLDKTCR